MRPAISLLLGLLLVLCLTTGASAQLGRWDDERSGDLETMIREGRMRPFVEVDYGVAQPRYSGMAGDFATLGILELKLGYGAVDSLRSALVKLDERYAFGSLVEEGIRPVGSTEEGEDLAKLGRFGFGNRLGYGYGWPAVTLELYNQNGLAWTSLEAAGDAEPSPEAAAIYDRFGTQYRFGQHMEAGVKVHLARSIAVSAGVEGAVVYPRHVFWPWLGSAMIYSGVQGGLEFFADQIVQSSPTLGPILHFLLKNGASLGYYLLVRDDMNWPFASETPLTVESFKLGAAITF